MPKRKNDTLTRYKFTQERHCIVLRIYLYPRKRAKAHKLTAATFARFVYLANNSKRYKVKICNDGGIGLEMQRELIVCQHGKFFFCPHKCDPNGLEG